MTGSNLSAAIAYGRGLGWAVFPVGENGRQPLCAHGYKDASGDPDVIRRLWARPSSNIALATGAVSGVFVLDVDIKGAASGRDSLRQLQAEHGALPLTPRAATPSGGEHFYFVQPDRRIRNRVGFRPGLDVRTDGGSVCLPPSRRADGAYEWIIRPSEAAFAAAPVWLLDIIDPPAPALTPRQPLKLGNVSRAARYVERAVDGECARVAQMAAGAGRNQALFKASANLAELVAAGLLPEAIAIAELQHAAAACGLTAEDGAHSVQATIASGFSRGLQRPREIAL